MRYTTISSLQQRGFKRYTNTDDIIRVIEDYSRKVNLLTEQLFMPIHLIERYIKVDNWSRLINTKNKIIAINSISYKADGSDTVYTVDESNYIPYDSYIELGTGLQSFDYETELSLVFGANYVRYRFNVDGIFGWIEKKQEPFQTTLTQDLVSNATSLTLSDVSELEPKDFLTIGKLNILIDTVDYNTNTITFDKLPTLKTVNSGTSCISYGKLLPDIERATILLCLASKKIEALGGRLKSERTDRYSYSLETGSISGVAEVDQILANYQAPVYVGFA